MSDQRIDVLISLKILQKYFEKEHDLSTQFAYAINKNTYLKNWVIAETSTLDSISNFVESIFSISVPGANIKKQSLQSIFTTLFGENVSGYYLPKPLSLDNLLPELNQNQVMSSQQIEKDLKRLLLNFLKEVEKVENFSQYYHTLEKYFWSIPHSIANPEISLFQYIKTSMAIGNCLKIQFDNNQINFEDIESGSTNDQMVLLSGDVSGIQDFIFNIPSVGAAKTLKGRSVYLGLLSEVIARYFLDKLELSEPNLLYNGGGNFYILAPFSQQVELNETKKEVLQKLLDVHNGEIYIAFGDVPFSVKEMSNFSNIWRKVSINTGKQKQKRWSEIGLKDNYKQVFGPLDKGSVEFCEMCRATSRKLSPQKEDDETIMLCSFCNSFKNLTNDLRDAKYVWFRKRSPSDTITSKTIESYNDVFSRFGYSIEFEKELKTKEKKAENGKDKEKGQVFTLNTTDFLPECDGYKFGAYNLPINADNSQLTFTDLAERSVEEGLGDKKLGVLKLDVDNLGSIFINGFQEDKSIAKVTTLSRMMGLFFEGYINQIIRENSWENRLYVVFSGGDDTFVVGAWNTVFEFARELRDRFELYTCKNPKITFSAGLTIIGDKFPVVRAASLTEEALERAKHYVSDWERQNISSRELPQKNKISLFGEVFNWGEFKKVEEIKSFLVRLILKHTDKKGNPNSRAILYKVMKSTKGFKDILQGSVGKNIYNIKFWRLAYYLRDLKDEDAEKLIDYYRNIVIDNLMKKPTDQKIQNIMIIPAAVRWAELATKDYQSEEEK